MTRIVGKTLLALGYWDRHVSYLSAASVTTRCGPGGRPPRLRVQPSCAGIVVWRGDVVAAEAGKITKHASLGTDEELKGYIKPMGDWHQMEVIADRNP